MGAVTLNILNLSMCLFPFCFLLTRHYLIAKQIIVSIIDTHMYK